MARIRTIKPETFTSQTLAQVSLAAERTFIGLWTQADDEGRLKDQPNALNGALWSERENDNHTAADMRKDLADLAGVGLLCRYTAAGREFMHLPTFLEHQRINRPTPSKIPPCPTHDGGSDTADAGDQLALSGADAS